MALTIVVTVVLQVIDHVLVEAVEAEELVQVSIKKGVSFDFDTLTL